MSRNPCSQSSARSSTSCPSTTEMLYLIQYRTLVALALVIWLLLSRVTSPSQSAALNSRFVTGLKTENWNLWNGLVGGGHFGEMPTVICKLSWKILKGSLAVNPAHSISNFLAILLSFFDITYFTWSRTEKSLNYWTSVRNCPFDIQYWWHQCIKQSNVRLHTPRKMYFQEASCVTKDTTGVSATWYVH